MYTIRDVKSRDFLPFVICDTMGLEMGLSEGVHPDDIISVLQGQIKTGYKVKHIFNTPQDWTHLNTLTHIMSSCQYAV